MPLVVTEAPLKDKLTTIQDLRNHPELLNDKQKIGLKYYEEILERIPREEIELAIPAWTTAPRRDYQMSGFQTNKQIWNGTKEQFHFFCSQLHQNILF